MEEEQAALEEQTKKSKELEDKVIRMRELSEEVKKLVEYMDEVEQAWGGRRLGWTWEGERGLSVPSCTATFVPAFDLSSIIFVIFRPTVDARAPSARRIPLGGKINARHLKPV